jgi:hypothetical protein
MEFCWILLPFLHSLTGCDSTSRLFGIGKGIALKRLNQEYLKAQGQLFMNTTSSKLDVIHWRPCFLHTHRLVSQFCLQLHLMIFSSFSGAGGSSIRIGQSFPRFISHPQSVGSISTVSDIHFSLNDTTKMSMECHKHIFWGIVLFWSIRLPTHT